MTLESIVSDVFAYPVQAINDTLKFREIPRWDSLAHMMLIVRLEEHYKIQLSSDEIVDITSVGVLRKILSTHGMAA